jgi:hypothetical protein
LSAKRVGNKRSDSGGSGAGSPPASVWIVLGLVGLALIAGTVLPGLRGDSGEKNLHVLQAAAWLHGRLDLDRRVYDTAFFNGRTFVPFPPFPALLLLPWVAAFGAQATKPALVSLALTALNWPVLSAILGKLDVPAARRPWICGAFFFGTAYWLCVSASSGVYFFSHIVAVTALLLAVLEALGRGRGLLVGLALGAAFLSRQMTVFAGVMLAAAVWQNANRKTTGSRALHLAGLAAAFAVCAAGYLYYNKVRFGSPLDTGYAYIQLGDFLDQRVRTYGLFHPAYVPSNFAYMFLQGPHLEFKPPTFMAVERMDPFGTSLTFASPFLAAAFAARGNRLLLGATWASVLLILGSTLLYYNNGWVQNNAQRFALDFLPLLIVPVAIGTNRADERWWKASVVYSLALNLLAFLGVPVWLRLASRLRLP